MHGLLVEMVVVRVNDVLYLPLCPDGENIVSPS